jgi:serine/threonine protein kinase/Leucine-rich repeat (LRR) protein
MALDDRLSDLLVDWEQSQRDGREPTLEELCKDAPDLLPVVRQSIDSLKATRWMFEPVPARTSADDRSTDRLRAALHDTELPASHLTVEQFAASIFQSGLLSPAEIHELNQRLTASDLPGEAREIASRLVTEGKLTRYQASVLLKASKDPLLIDNYVILDTLDTGGMGLVFKALHRSMNRVVALKLLPAAMMSARDTVKRFQREVQAAAALSHPNVVAAYDAHQSAEIAYLVLEYVEGINLFRLVKEQGPLPVAVAANYVRQAATGLAYLHSRGIIHRDVKPANLILADDGTVKLLDMGLVRFASAEDLSCAEMDQELTQAGIVIGTVAYMSPEQALDTRSADQRSDIYSLGCTLFFLLTGRSLYHEETGMKTLLAHREQPVPTIREFCEEAPVSLDAVFRTMVAKRPADRLQTMTEVVAALDACVPGLAANSPAGVARPFRAGATPVTMNLGRGWKRLRSSPLKIALAIAILAGLSAGGTYLAGILIQIKTRQGTTDVRVDDPDAEVSVKRVGDIPTKSVDVPGATIPGTRTFESAGENADRRLAVWVVNLGGVFETGGKEIGSIKDIPGSPFTITKIQFGGDFVDDAALNYLAAFRPPDLRALYLTSTKITDKGLEALRTLSRLILLDLTNTSITDEGVQRLCFCLTQLQELNLSRTRITDKSLGLLPTFPQLTDLTLDQTQISDAGMAHLPKLKSLSLARTPISDAGLKLLEKQSWLLKLDLSGTHATESGVAQLKAALPICEIEDRNLRPSAKTAGEQMQRGGAFSGRNRHRMSASGVESTQTPTAAAAPKEWESPLAAKTATPASVDRLVANWMISNFRGTIWIRELPRRPIQREEDLPSGNFHIEAIVFNRGASGIGFGKVDIDRLASLSELKSLELAWPSVTDDTVLRLKPLTRLWRLSLAKANITDACLPALAGMAHLESLDLSEIAGITDAGLEQLAKIKSLNNLGLNRTTTTEAGLIKLQRVLPNCSISASHVYPGNETWSLPLPPPPGSSDRAWAVWLLDQGSLKCWVVTDVDPATTITVSKDLPPIDFHIRCLSFIELPPTQRGFPSNLNLFLIRRLGDLQYLRDLDLEPQLPPSALEGLVAVKSLRTLRIGEANAGDAFLSAVAPLTGLSALNLNGGQITDAGVRSLAPLKGLTVLQLSGHARNLRGTGFVALSGLTKLQTLDVANSGLDDDGARGIGRLASLEKLGVRGTWMSGKGLAELASLPHLKVLNLSRCRRLQSPDIECLVRFPALERLSLDNCRIDDSCLDTLKQLTKLQTLILTGTALSPHTFDLLKSALPRCHVVQWPESPNLEIQGGLKIP